MFSPYDTEDDKLSGRVKKAEAENIKKSTILFWMTAKLGHPNRRTRRTDSKTRKDAPLSLETTNSDLYNGVETLEERNRSSNLKKERVLSLQDDQIYLNHFARLDSVLQCKNKKNNILTMFTFKIMKISKGFLHIFYILIHSINKMKNEAIKRIWKRNFAHIVPLIFFTKIREIHLVIKYSPYTHCNYF